jgi:hypothetical protein
VVPKSIEKFSFSFYHRPTSSRLKAIDIDKLMVMPMINTASFINGVIALLADLQVLPPYAHYGEAMTSTQRDDIAVLGLLAALFDDITATAIARDLL